MYWLVQGCKAGDSLVFHFSGHGAQQRNRDGGEIDGFDETILPMDFQTQGMIVDDVINEAFTKWCAATCSRRCMPQWNCTGFAFLL